GGSKWLWVPAFAGTTDANFRASPRRCWVRPLPTPPPCGNPVTTAAHGGERGPPPVMEPYLLRILCPRSSRGRRGERSVPQPPSPRRRPEPRAGGHSANGYRPGG